MQACKNKAVPVIMLLISLAGFLVFYILPFIFSFFFALMDNPISKSFVGFKNFADLFGNEFFIRGFKNTSIFMLVSIPLNIVISLLLALAINKIKIFKNVFGLIFLIPLVIPSATMAVFWQILFDKYGWVNYFVSHFGIAPIDWFNSDYGIYVVIFIFLWKNAGYNMALFVAGLNNIPAEYYECAEVFGANAYHKFYNVTIVYLTPTLLLTLIMTFVNSFKVFKEVYIITGDHPHENLYMLQHFINSMFLSLNYQRLVSAVYILTVIIVFFVAVIFKAENRISKNL